MTEGEARTLGSCKGPAALAQPWRQVLCFPGPQMQLLLEFEFVRETVNKLRYLPAHQLPSPNVRIAS